MSREAWITLNATGVERIRLKNLWLQSTLKAIRLIPVLNERSVSDGGNLCPLLLVIFKSVRHIGDTL